jgi:hypothetical protein
VYVRPTHQGRPLTFGVSGMLWKDALIMYDRETDTLWSHVTARAIHGPLTGQELTPYPALHTTWGEWKRLHPDGQILSKRTFLGLPRGRENVYADYMADPNRFGIFGTHNPDPVLPGKEVIFGLTLHKARVAYPFRHLSRVPLAHDTVAGEPALVVFVESQATAVAFSRRTGGHTLQFTRLREARGHWLMEDTETRSVWRALTGEAIAGPLTGSVLTPLPGHQVFWFAWRRFYPESRLWTGL